MKRIILIFLILTSVILPQAKKSVLTDAQRDSIQAMIDASGGGSLPDSVLFSSDSTDQRTFSDAKYPNKYLSNLGTTSINSDLLFNAHDTYIIGNLNYRPHQIYTSQLYIGSLGSDMEFSTSLLTTHRTFTFPNASGTIALGTGTSNQLSYWSGINTLGSLALDPATLEINGSNQLTVIGGTGSSGWFGLDGNGDLMPSLTATSDEYYELDGNGDIMPQL